MDVAMAETGGGTGEHARGVTLPEDGSSAASRFDALFSELLPRLYRRAVLLTGDENAAEDAVQATYLRLAPHPDQLVDHAHPFAYLVATVVDAIGAPGRRRRRLVLVGVDGGGPADALEPLGVREAQWQAIWLLRQLSPSQAAAVLLVDLDGYTIDEVATVLKVHPGAVSRARRRALVVMRDLLKDRMR